MVRGNLGQARRDGLRRRGLGVARVNGLGDATVLAKRHGAADARERLEDVIRSVDAQ